MTQYNREELISILQMLLAIFISFTLTRFLSIFAVNFNVYAVFSLIAGATILYLCLKRSNHFNVFFGYLCVMTIPCALLYVF